MKYWLARQLMVWVLRPLFFLLSWRDRELAHDLALNCLEWVENHPKIMAWLVRQQRPTDPRLQQDQFNVTFKGLVGLAAGFTKNGRGLLMLSKLFDFIVVGTVIPEERAGRERPRIFYLWTWAAGYFPFLRLVLLNRMSFPSHGKKTAVDNICRYGRLDVPIGVSLGAVPTEDSQQTVNDILAVYQEVQERADQLVDFFEINLSSPNTKGVRELASRDYFQDFISSLVRGLDGLNRRFHWRQKMIVFKVSPDMPNVELLAMAEVCVRHGFYFLAATNTTTSRTGLSGRVTREAGGISGWYLHDLALDTLETLRRNKPELNLVGIGGIDSFEAAKRMVVAGDCVLFQCLTSFVRTTPLIRDEINAGFSRALNQAGGRDLSWLRRQWVEQPLDRFEVMVTKRSD